MPATTRRRANRRVQTLAGALAVCFMGACRSAPHDHEIPARPSASASSAPVWPITSIAPAASAPDGPKPPPFAALPVAGFGDAVVASPSSGEASLLVIALHGNFDRPEWQCATWRDITHASAFVLCPRGSPRSDSPPADPRYTFDALARVARELGAARVAFDRRHPSARPRSLVLAGFSLGGVLAAHLAAAAPADYPRLVVVEGGDRAWSPEKARRFADAGGRLLAVCTASWCRRRFSVILPWFGNAARLEHVPGAGHTYGGPVARAVADAWGFVVGPRR